MSDFVFIFRPYSHEFLRELSKQISFNRLVESLDGPTCIYSKSLDTSAGISNPLVTPLNWNEAKWKKKSLVFISVGKELRMG